MATSSIARRPIVAASGSSVFRRAVIRAPLVAYFTLACAGTWLALLPAALSRGAYGLGVLPFPVPEAVAFILVMLSAYTGPLLAAFTVTGIAEGRAGVGQLRRRIGLWRVAPRWYLITICASAVIWL